MLQKLHSLVCEGLARQGEQAKARSPQELEREMADFLAMDGSQMRRISWVSLLEAEETAVNRHPEARTCWLDALRLWQKGSAVAWTDALGLHFSFWDERVRGAIEGAAWVVWMDASALPSDLAGLLRQGDESVEDARRRMRVLRADQALVGAEVQVKQIAGLGPLGYRRTPAQTYWLHLTLGGLLNKGLVTPAEAAVIDTLKGL